LLTENSRKCIHQSLIKKCLELFAPPSHYSVVMNEIYYINQHLFAPPLLSIDLVSVAELWPVYLYYYAWCGVYTVIIRTLYCSVFVIDLIGLSVVH